MPILRELRLCGAACMIGGIAGKMAYLRGPAARGCSIEGGRSRAILTGELPLLRGRDVRLMEET